MRLCHSCLLPDSKPDLRFAEDGVCAACHSFESRIEVDWHSRAEDFSKLARDFGRNSTSYDCIVPVSGGKDSTYQVLKMKSLGLNPLAVTSQTCDLTPIGRRNIDNLRALGVDHINVAPDPKVRAKLNRLGLTTVGDISWPEHVGIFTIPVRVAVWLKIPLIVWGENSQNEYGGPEQAAKNAVLDRRWLEEFGGLLGLRVSDIPQFENLSEADLFLYNYPDEQEILELGLRGLFLGHFFPWDGLSNALVAQANGLETTGKAIEGSMVDYENLDNYQTGIHDYFKFLKFGFGRVSDIASLHIRRGRLSREDGLRLVKDREGLFPWTYLGKPLQEILEPLGMSVEEFIRVCDQFTNRDLFAVDHAGELIKDPSGNLQKVRYDNDDN